jgi:mono/diheme cytochrome c family protein
VPDDGLDQDCDGSDLLTWATVEPLFSRAVGGCVGCHYPAGGSGGLSFSSSTQLVNVASGNSIAGVPLDYVEPGSPSNSYLYRKLEGTQGAGNGSRMPLPGAPYFSVAELALVSEWITDGALP